MLCADCLIRTGVDKGWAIEVLWDREDIEDHCRRFAPEGNYSLGSKAMNLQITLYLIFAVLHCINSKVPTSWYDSMNPQVNYIY